MDTTDSKRGAGVRKSSKRRRGNCDERLLKGRLNYYRYIKLRHLYGVQLTISSKQSFLENYGREMNESELKLLDEVVSMQCAKRGPKITTIGAQFKFRLCDRIALDLLKQSAQMARRNGLILLGVDHLVASLRHKHGDKKAQQILKMLKQ